MGRGIGWESGCVVVDPSAAGQHKYDNAHAAGRCKHRRDYATSTRSRPWMRLVAAVQR